MTGPASKPLDLRAAIIARLAELDKTGYWLAAESGLARTLVYEYLGGKRDCTGQTIAAMLSALGLEVRSGRRGRRR